ncbi:DUF3631 domain-containing protein [Streptomyces albireticuli]|uniref:DUF3631 domain-containing protein n=1 Tax=Streptomyces albireticuli TaxID=1940 RepID=A0A2A2DAA1_9ACTN|nr:DUF3631 domain-containing protein [Streptomyces albireticuli]MCD9193386.1 DUF3631 domain-containing protein [Streptomyces albireticuli]PAU48401.1 hypothetical protein CK936_13490 [Streptomyces albireticuli]
MTPSPTFLAALVTSLLEDEPVQENPHHRRLLDTLLEIQQLDQQIFDFAGTDTPTGACPFGDVVDFAGLLLARVDAGDELRQLLSSPCCCPTPTAAKNAPADVADAPHPSWPEPSESIVHACLKVFADLGDPDAMASTDLVSALRHLPGAAEGHWRYADLTPARLAKLLACYEVSTRDITLPDGRRRKSYRRAALQSTLRDRLC